MMSQVLLAFRWYLVVQLFGLAALPLCVRLFRYLPDRGYGVSKPLGLLLTGWVFWLLTTLGWLQNTAGGILVALALIAVAGVALHLHLARWPVGLPSIQTILVTEAVFALAFVAWCGVRAHMPRITTAGGEKWMEIAFLRAILRSHTFPPHDPWLSGFAISYYYFGYVIVAAITRLAAVPPSIAFNLGIATLFALVSTGAFSLVYDLLVAGGAWTRARAAGAALLGPLLLVVTGNLEGLLEMLHARGIGPAAFWEWLNVRSINRPPPPFSEGSWVPQRFFWWWQASRTLHDLTPWGADQEVIDEFPAFSFILGDMHPHVLALPFVLLALALALNLYRRLYRRVSEPADRPRAAVPLSAWEFLVYAICLGGLGFLNTWDFPIYLFVVAAAYALAYARRRDSHLPPGSSGFVFYGSRFALFFGAFLIGGLFLYLPFWIGFRSQAGGILPNLFNATRFSHFVLMFGPLLFVGAAFVIARARQGGVRVGQVTKWTLIVWVTVVGVLALVLVLAMVLVVLEVIPPVGPLHSLDVWLSGGVLPGGEEGAASASASVTGALLKRLLNPWTALVLTALLVTSIFLLLPAGYCRPDETDEGSQPARSTNSFALLLLATGALLTLGVEYVYLRDNFGTRMNTVFKFYFQAWVLWAIAGAYALANFVRRERWVVVALAALLVAAGLIYPALAIPTRRREYGGPPTLDGAAYLAQTYADDYAAIAWLNDHVDGAPVILEAPADSFQAYVYEGRVSAHTGLPTVLGWAGHEHQWRGSYEEQARREPDIEALYTSVDPKEVLTLLDKYGIRYVYVGPVEQRRYPPAGLAKFAGLMERVYSNGSVTIYRR